MSLVQKQIYRGMYAYLQYRDADGRNQSFYVGRMDDPKIGRKKRAVWATYQMAMIENRLKQWIGFFSTSTRKKWLVDARDGKITDDHRRRALLVAYAMLGQFHKDVCEPHDAGRQCMVERTLRLLDREFPWIQEL